MGQILVRKIEETVKARLRRRALRHGRSMEEEIREILRNAARDDATSSVPLGRRIAARFTGIGLDFEISEQRAGLPRPAKFRK